VSWALYWAVVGYAIVNISVERALFTPLTWPMLRAARGPLLDSLLAYVTWTNAAYAAITAAVAMLPVITHRVRVRHGGSPAALKPGVAAAAAVVVALGPAAGSRIETLGLDRNIIGALVTGMFPEIDADAAVRNWRASPFGSESASQDLAALRGIAHGRNVILVSLESTGAQYLGLYGAKRDPAPHLSALAANAVVFDNAYAVYPESIKGLFSTLCAAYPAFDTSPDAYGQAICRGLPAVLAKAGYKTALFHSGRFGYLGMDAVIRNRGYDVLEDAGDIGGDRNSSFGVDEPSTVKRALAWIDRRPPGAPFFLTYLPVAGHHPYEAPHGGPFTNANDEARYLNAINYGDAALGALVEGLRQRGLDNDTVWIIMGDHGEAFGQHHGNFGHTFFLYDENVHVPFVIAVPGALWGQTRVPQSVSLIDTAPTILDLIGLSVPTEYQGTSVLDEGRRMALFFTDYSLGMVGLRDGRLKFIHELHSGRSRMFDLGTDPQEHVDIAASHGDRVQWYKTDLLEWASLQKSRLKAQDSGLRAQVAGGSGS
jgi:arylsulfatase A-like enzyme